MLNAKTVSNIEEVLNKELSSVANWTEKNKLTVNASKIKVMLLGCHHKLKHAQINISFNQVIFRAGVSLQIF